MLLLGIGWNAGLIGGSALLRDAAVAPSVRIHAEGIGELGMGAGAAAGGGGAGFLLATGGYGLVGLAAATPCLLVLAVVITAAMAAGRRRTRPAKTYRSSAGSQTDPAGVRGQRPGSEGQAEVNAEQT